MKLILYAVPLFFLLIFIELIYGYFKGSGFYRLNDSLTSLATGTINQLVSVSKALVPFTLYIVFYQHLAIFELSSGVVVWIAAFILYDLCYYWNHRFGHEVNIFWAAHVVHHSSEEYNLTTALRQSGTGFFSFIFYLPLALIGFGPLVIVSVAALNLIYQFWVHTRHIGKLAWCEKIFVTPSNHRGHHAQNTVYIDRNYGGVFIVWDRIFGTYQEELEHDKPVYGIRGAVQSWNPLWVNFQVYSQLLHDAYKTQHWWYKLTLWFRRTGWRPLDVVDVDPIDKPDDLSAFSKYQTTVTGPLKFHCLIQYAVTAMITVALMLSFKQLSLSEHMYIAGFVLLSSFSVGALMENTHYSGVLEWLRLSLLLIAAILLPLPKPLSVVLLAGVFVCVPLLWIGRRQALRLRLDL